VRSVDIISRLLATEAKRQCNFHHSNTIHLDSSNPEYQVSNRKQYLNFTFDSGYRRFGIMYPKFGTVIKVVKI
jgi:hypothetical protein